MKISEIILHSWLSSCFFWSHVAVFRIEFTEQWRGRGKGVSTQWITQGIFLQLYTVLRENTCGSDRNGSLVPKSKYLSPSRMVWASFLVCDFPSEQKSKIISLQNENGGEKWWGYDAPLYLLAWQLGRAKVWVPLNLKLLRIAQNWRCLDLAWRAEWLYGNFTRLITPFSTWVPSLGFFSCHVQICYPSTKGICLLPAHLGSEIPMAELL